LFTELSDASDGDKTASDTISTYDCPSDFLELNSYVKIGSNNYEPISVKDKRRREISDPKGYWCYISGSEKNGFKLNVNSEISLTAGDTISYDYYKTVSLFANTTDTSEMKDPYFLVYFVLSRLYKNDGESYQDEFTKAEARLEQMAVDNMTGYQGVPDNIQETPIEIDGFGI